MKNDKAETKTALVTREQVPAEAILVRQIETLVLTPVINLEVAKRRLEELQQFVKYYLTEGEDYGVIPGTPKPTLFKSGADKLCDIYGLADTYQVLSKTEDFDRTPELFDYTLECTLFRRGTDVIIGTGLGSCNSYEGRYRFRDSQRICPVCGKPQIIKGKEEFGGGWLCWQKKGGCGAKFADGDAKIEDQPTGKVTNEDLPTSKNSILKIAKKRAKVDAVISATRSSGLFTQDLEDIGAPPDANAPKPPVKQPTRASAKPADAASGRAPNQPPREVPKPVQTVAPPPAKSNGAEKKPKAAPKTESQFVTASQVKLFWGIARDHHWLDPDVKELLKRHGVEHSDQIPAAKLDALLEELRGEEEEPGENG
jgi:hypothetical protein